MYACMYIKEKMLHPSVNYHHRTCTRAKEEFYELIFFYFLLVLLK